MLALEQNGYTGLWEVSTQAAANQADKMLSSLGITNITVVVVSVGS
jgi:filamentous hemagglutinin